MLESLGGFSLEQQFLNSVRADETKGLKPHRRGSQIKQKLISVDRQSSSAIKACFGLSPSGQ